MSFQLRLLSGALTTVLALVLSATSATSNKSIEVRPAGNIGTSAKLTINGTSLNASSAIQCDVTLLRTIASRIPKISGTQWGRVTGLAIDRGETRSSPHCQVGSAFRRLNDLAPLASSEAARHRELGAGILLYDLTTSSATLWNLIYDSFQGTLPELIGINFHIRGVGLQLDVAGVFGETDRCLYSGEAYGLLRISLRRSTAAEIVPARTRLTRTSGGFACSPIGTPATLGGMLAVRPTLDVFLLDPAPPSPIVVAVGDSYIAGEGGRWAGNTAELRPEAIDALGPSAYFDEPRGLAESIPFCHRSLAAEIHLGNGVISKNLACSGARTYTFFEGEKFKPGLDFWFREGRKSQSVMLRDYAEEHRDAIKLVVISIGGNDFSFGQIIENCVSGFLVYRYCNEESFAVERMAEPNVRIVTAGIKNAILNVSRAMEEAGYASSSYKIVVQNYPSPIPLPGFTRYDETYRERLLTGGCPIYDADLNWANRTALTTINAAIANAIAETRLTNIRQFRLEDTFRWRTLCRTGVGLLEEKGMRSWTELGAVDETEWITQIRTRESSPFMKQEGLHPNYWAELALRNCLRVLFNYAYGEPLQGSCILMSNGLNQRGEPIMALNRI